MNKLIIILLLLGYLIPLGGLLFVSNCEQNSITACLMEKEYLISDFEWHYNIIKYVATYVTLPRYVLDKKDGGYDGASLDGKTKRVSQSPLYYYWGAGILKIARGLNLNPLLSLHILSITLMLLANIAFFFLMKKLSISFNPKKDFVFYSTALSIFLPTNLFAGLFIQGHSLFYLFMILSFYYYVKFLEEKSLKNSFLFGILLGLCLFSSLAGLPLLVILGLHILWDYFKKKWKEGNLLLIPLFIGILFGSFVLVRNYILYGEWIWGATINLTERSFYVFVRVARAFFGGIYGGYRPIYILILLASLFIVLITLYGFLKTPLWKKKLNFIWMTGLITLLLAAYSLCNPQTILKNFECIGGSIIHGRYLLGLSPGLALFFSIGLISLSKKTILNYLIVSLICALFTFDFIYAFIFG